MKKADIILKTAMLAGLVFGAAGCSEEDKDAPGPVIGNTEFALGWKGEDKPEEIPSNIYLDLGNNTLPVRHTIESRLPPIGDQGQYGTCVTWAAGYNLKTLLNALDGNYSASQLSDPGRQASPKDLFLAIPASDKGTDCGGTNFEPAFRQLIDRGVASMNSVPYTGLGACSQSPDPAVKQEAGKNKLSNFRKIGMGINEIKTYISQNRPVVFGAKLSDNFMTWRSDQVLSSHSSFANVGQHAYHAMVIVGYDDQKGANGAFRVVNSWGNAWGDRGFIWIDYRFMVNPQFGMMAFIATNGVRDDYNPVDPPEEDEAAASGQDLVPWNVSDVKNSETSDQLDREMTYNVYNTGTQGVTAKSRWNICYLYYNAFDAKDFGILLYDEYTDRYGSPGQNGKLESGGHGIAGNWWNNVNLPAGKGVAETIFNTDRIYWEYKMPKITGFYYLVCVADAFDAITETNEANNYHFLTAGSGAPVLINNGVISAKLSNANARTSGAALKPDRRTALPEPRELGEKGRNAYTREEISGMITSLKKSGALRTAVEEFQSKRGKRRSPDLR